MVVSVSWLVPARHWASSARYASAWRSACSARAPQVDTQLVAVTGGVSAKGGQHLLRVGADPVGLGPGGLLSRLRAGGILLRQPDGLFFLRGPCEGVVPIGHGGAYVLVGLGAGLLDSGVPIGFSGRDPPGGVLAGLADAGVPVGLAAARAASAWSARVWAASICTAISSAAASASARH
jgi:hypothetical protein